MRTLTTKRPIGQIGRVRQQVALLDMLDMSWYNGCPLGGHPGPARAGTLPKNFPITMGSKNHGALYDSFKKSPVYIKISLYDGLIKSPGICLYDRLQKCRGIYFKTIRHKTYRYIDIG